MTEHMQDEMSYFLVTETSIARDSKRKMNVSFPVETVFVICNENEIDRNNIIPNFCQFKSIFPLHDRNVEKIAQTIFNHCKSFPEEKVIFIDQDILQQERYLQLYQLLSQSLSKIEGCVYFIDFEEEQKEKDFIEIKVENNDPILFDQLQDFGDALKKE